MTMIPTTGITFKVEGVRHPCRVQFYINGVPVTDLGAMEEVEGIWITGIAADRIGVDALEDGVDVTVTGRLRCPPNPERPATIIILRPPQDDDDGDDGDEDDDVDVGEIVLQTLKTLLLPFSFPWWLLWLIAYLIALALDKLGDVEPTPEDVKEVLQDVGEALPDWLQDLLELN